LTDREVETIRELAASFKPKLHLLKSNWRYCEVRGIAEARSAQLIETLKGMGLQFRVD